MGRTRRVLLAAGMALMIMGISGNNDTLAGQETDKTVSAYQRETAEKQKLLQDPSVFPLFCFCVSTISVSC